MMTPAILFHTISDRRRALCLQIILPHQISVEGMYFLYPAPGLIV